MSIVSPFEFVTLSIEIKMESFEKRLTVEIVGYVDALNIGASGVPLTLIIYLLLNCELFSIHPLLDLSQVGRAWQDRLE